MITITVGKSGDSHYTTLGEALLCIPYNTPATIQIEPGIYTEKVFCEKKDITLIGAGADKTIITWADGDYHTHADGNNTGTFRSYTAFFGGDRVRAQDLCIANTTGDGRIMGQGIAAYVDASIAYFENVRLIGCQDTLFCAPLPAAERQQRGFFGPRAILPRLLTEQYFSNCKIEGDVDFIFGGADVYFENCEIKSLDRGEDINGYVTAPSGKTDGLGLVFDHCQFTSNCAPATVYLGRPWRPEGKTALLHCELGEHIKPEGWSRWNDGEDTATFAEYQCTGPGSEGERAYWAKQMTKPEAEIVLQRAQELKSRALYRADN